jgi:TonB family protein
VFDQGGRDHGRLCHLPELRLLEVRLTRPGPAGSRTRIRPLHTRARGFALLAVLFGGAVGATEPAPSSIPFSAPVTVSPDGATKLGAIEGLGGAIATAVQAELSRVRFAPAMRDGMRMETRLRLRGEAILVPDGDGFLLRLEDLRAHPVILETLPPDYPREQLMKETPGRVELVAEVSADGRVSNVRPVAATHRHFERAARDVLRQWRFVPPVEGRGFEVTVPFSFEVNGARLPPDFECAPRADSGGVEGQDGCIDTVVTTGIRLRR